MKTWDYLQEFNVSQSEPASLKIAKVNISSLTAKTFFEQYQKATIPVIITGLLNTIPEWNLDYLCQYLGDRKFPIRYYGRSRYQQDKRQWQSFGSSVKTQMMPFSHYAEMLRNGEAKKHDNYLGHYSLKHTPLEKELSTLEIAQQPLGLKLPATYYNIWLGLGGHTTCLHCDPVDSVLMQLYGAKKIILFPPSQLYNLYPVPVIKQLIHGSKLRASYSQVYPERPDFEAFPKFKKALEYRYDCILDRGEVMLIPAGWWHEVTSLGNDMVCSVNRFWHVRPFWRTKGSWNSWRIHLGSILATHHQTKNLWARKEKSNQLK